MTRQTERCQNPLIYLVYPSGEEPREEKRLELGAEAVSDRQSIIPTIIQADRICWVTLAAWRVSPGKLSMLISSSVAIVYK